jgi:uncharacterized protein (TIGR01777 family)
MPRFIWTSDLAHPTEEVFLWHTRQGALTRLTPPWEQVRVLASDQSIRDGAEVRIAMRRGPVELKWTVRHQDYIDGRQFVDVQIDGPFARWVHTHRFEPLEGGSATRMMDEIEWAPPLGALGRLLGGPVIESDLARSFAFRHRRLRQDLALHARWADRPRRTVAVTGATGLLGSALCALLTTGGHRVVRLVRRPDRAAPDTVLWDPAKGEIDQDGLRAAGVDSIVHLAGESISGLRWTPAKKQAILDSRVAGTRLVAEAAASNPSIDTLVMASAVGFYGDRGDERLTEASGPGKGFLAEVCQKWEAAAQRAEGAGVRTAKLRLGVVLSPAGGALAAMLPAFRAGVGGRVGPGRQYMPWVDLDDATGVFYHTLMNPEVSGVLNVTAPHPVTNANFTDTIGRVLRRPTLLPVPSLGVKAALGEMGNALLLQGQRAEPEATRASGYEFAYSSLEESLRHQLGRTAPTSSESPSGQP